METGNEFDLWGFEYGGSLYELKEWVDKQIAEGKTKVSLDISWGYYNDLDGLTLTTE